MYLKKYKDYILENNLDLEKEYDIVPFTNWYIINNDLVHIISQWQEHQQLNEDYVIIATKDKLPLSSDIKELKEKYEYKVGNLYEKGHNYDN